MRRLPAHTSPRCLAGSKPTIAGLQAGYRGNVVEIITHPLWDCDPNRFGPHLTAAHAQAVAGGSQVRFKSVFEVLRRPF